MWLPVKGSSEGVVIYPFSGGSELPDQYRCQLCLGDAFKILGESPDKRWLVGKRTGIADTLCVVPTTYVHKVPSVNDDEIVTEIATVVREWVELWKTLFKKGHDYQLNAIGGAIRELIEGRRQLMNGSLTKEQSEEIRLKLANKIDWGNKKLGLDLVPREGYQVIKGGGNIGVAQLYQYHWKSAGISESAKMTIRRRQTTTSRDSTTLNHLYLAVRDFNCALGDDCEIYLALFDSNRGTLITERHFTSIPSSNSTFMDKLQTISALFTDLSMSDVTSNLYLVAYVMRIGRMFPTDTLSKKASQNYRRPFAAGVLNIYDTLIARDKNDSQEKESTFRLYTCDEKDFWQIPELIIKNSSKITVSSYTFTVTLRTFSGELGSVMDDNRILFKNVTVTQKIGFADVIMPGVVRNDLYITVMQGEFEKSGKTMGGKNISVTICAFDSGGHPVDNCVYSACNLQNYESMILYHNNTPKWCEVIKVNISTEKFMHLDIHLRFEFRHCSTKEKNEKKLFGFTFLKLMDDQGTLIKDTMHCLPVYKCDDSSLLRPENYLTGIRSPLQKSPKECFYINTHLVSTKLTQNVDLVSLLKWKSEPSMDKIKQTLINMKTLPGEELVKFLQDVLDVLFDMFTDENGSSTSYSNDAFVVLVNIFTLLEDSKFENFKPVMDAYIENHFAATLVYKGLIAIITHYARNLNGKEKDHMEQVQKCFRTFDHIFKFAVQSQVLFTTATSGSLEDTFRLDINEMFQSFCILVAGEYTMEPFVFTQCAFLLNLKHVYSNLMRVLPVGQLSRCLLNVFKNIPLYQSAHLLSPAKLTAILDLVSSTLFQQKACRTILLSEVCRHVRHHLTIRDELDLTSNVLLAILGTLYEGRSSNHDDIEVLATNILEPLINSVLILERTSPIIVPLVVTLISLYEQMTDCIYNRIFDEFKDLSQIRNFILRSLYVFRDLIKFDVFKDDWFKMKVLTNAIILKSIRNYSSIIVSYFLKPKYDADLFLEYFNICFTFILQSCLQLETFREGKSKWVLQEYGDMRILMCREILSVWNCIEEKIHFVPGLIGPILLVSLLPLEELGRTLLPLIVDLIDVQFRVFGDFHVVELELIERLDEYLVDNHGTEKFINQFNNTLQTKIEESDPSWKMAGQQLIVSIKALLEILFDFRTIPNDPEHKDKKMQCINNLLIFYKLVDSRELYLKYINRLHDLHVTSENYNEAGFTLLLHSELLNFSNDYETKERLQLQIIQYFDQGKLWECGIPLCKELAKIYEEKFEYTKLSNILIKTASFFTNIQTQLRPEPEYFRVSFVGMGFPRIYRNKEFIFRGFDYERITSFVQRIVEEWPDAELLKNSNPDNNLANSPNKYIIVRSVKPLPNHPSIYRSAPSRIKSYYNTNNINKFQYDQALSKNLDDVSSVYIERTVLETANYFPGILRCSLVTSKVVTVLTPVKFAVEKVTEINQQLESLVDTYSEPNGGATMNVNPLSMRLQGMLDANVQGGLPKYQEAFFNSEFLNTHPDAVEDVTNLKKQIRYQIEILDKALLLHGRIIPPGVQPLHTRLLECFNNMRGSFDCVGISQALQRTDSIRINSSIVHSPLPPLPSGINPNRISLTSLSSNYVLLNTSGEQEEEFYSLPSSQPPPIPNRKKKSLSIDGDSKCSERNDQTVSMHAINDMVKSATPPCTPPPSSASERNRTRHDSEYIVMPPSRVRELINNAAPPRPPKVEMEVNGNKTPPPVPPKPGSQKDGGGTVDRRSCHSNSSTGSVNNYKEFYIPPGKK